MNSEASSEQTKNSVAFAIKNPVPKNAKPMKNQAQISSVKTDQPLESPKEPKNSFRPYFIPTEIY